MESGKKVILAINLKINYVNREIFNLLDLHHLRSLTVLKSRLVRLLHIHEIKTTPTSLHRNIYEFPPMSKLIPIFAVINLWKRKLIQ